MKRIQLSSNELKIIAVIAMVFDHFVGGFVPVDSTFGLLLRCPGRIAAPIMCYLISEGYFHTKNLNKYISRLFIFSLISHVPYNLYFNLGFFQATSVMWSLCLGLIALASVNNEEIPILLKISIVGVCCLLAVRANWNYIAVLWIVFFGIFRGDRKKQFIAFTLIALIEIIPIYIGIGPVKESYPHFYRFGIFLALLIIRLYNGEKGKGGKNLSRLFYIVYPLHLLLLYIIRILI